MVAPSKLDTNLYFHRLPLLCISGSVPSCSFCAGPVALTSVPFLQSRDEAGRGLSARHKRVQRLLECILRRRKRTEPRVSLLLAGMTTRGTPRGLVFAALACLAAVCRSSYLFSNKIAGSVSNLGQDSGSVSRAHFCPLFTPTWSYSELSPPCPIVVAGADASQGTRNNQWSKNMR